MKKITDFTLFIYFTCICSFAFSQSEPTDCHPSGPFITTAPAAAVSNYQTNTWDWTNELFHVENSPVYTPYNSPPFCSGGQCGITNPYYEGTQPAVANIFNTDFANADGWELIKQDFGYLYDGSHNSNCSPTPYFILYNKYSGKLRVVGTLAEEGSHQIIDINLSFPKQSDWPGINLTGYGTSGLFAHYGPYTATLEDNAANLVYTTPAKYPGSSFDFFYGDFQMAYDPCTCQFPSALQVDFKLVDSMTVNMEGNILGTNIPVTDPTRTQLDPTNTWLSSVGNNFGGVNNGFQIYNTIGDLQTNYQGALSSYNSAHNTSTVLDYIGTIFSAVGEGLSGGAGAAGIVGGIFQGVGTVFSFAGTQVEKDKPTEPTVLYGQAKFAGTIYEATDDNSNNVIMGNPVPSLASRECEPILGLRPISKTDLCPIPET
jgi:hypothetical protein